MEGVILVIYGLVIRCGYKITYTSFCFVLVALLVSGPASTDLGSYKCPYSLHMSEEDRDRMNHD